MVTHELESEKEMFHIQVERSSIGIRRSYMKFKKNDYDVMILDMDQAKFLKDILNLHL